MAATITRKPVIAVATKARSTLSMIAGPSPTSDRDARSGASH